MLSLKHCQQKRRGSEVFIFVHVYTVPGSSYILARLKSQTQTQTYLFRQDCRKSKVHYLSRLRSCEDGREQD